MIIGVPCACRFPKELLRKSSWEHRKLKIATEARKENEQGFMFVPVDTGLQIFDAFWPLFSMKD